MTQYLSKDQLLALGLTPEALTEYEAAREVPNCPILFVRGHHYRVGSLLARLFLELGHRVLTLGPDRYSERYAVLGGLDANATYLCKLELERGTSKTEEFKK